MEKIAITDNIGEQLGELNALAPRGEAFLSVLRDLIANRGGLEDAVLSASRDARMKFITLLLKIPAPETYTALSIILMAVRPVLSDDGILTVLEREHGQYLERHWIGEVLGDSEDAGQSGVGREAGTEMAAGRATAPKPERPQTAAPAVKPTKPGAAAAPNPAAAPPEHGAIVAGENRFMEPLGVKAALERNFVIGGARVDDLHAVSHLMMERDQPDARINNAYGLAMMVCDKVEELLSGRLAAGENVYEIMTPVVNKATGEPTGQIVPSNSFAELKSIVESANSGGPGDVMKRKLISVEGTRSTKRVALGDGRFRYNYLVSISIIDLGEKAGNKVRKTMLRKVKGVWMEDTTFIRIKSGHQGYLLEALGVMKDGRSNPSFSNIMFVAVSL